MRLKYNQTANTSPISYYSFCVEFFSLYSLNASTLFLCLYLLWGGIVLLCFVSGFKKTTVQYICHHALNLERSDLWRTKSNKFQKEWLFNELLREMKWKRKALSRCINERMPVLWLFNVLRRLFLWILAVLVRRTAVQEKGLLKERLEKEIPPIKKKACTCDD